MEYILPLGIFFILFAVLAWRDRRLALFLFALLLPAYLIRFPVGPLPSTALEVMAVILLIRWASTSSRESIERILKSPFFYPGLVLLVAAGFSVLWSTDMRAALGIFKAYFLEPFLIYCLFVDWLREEEDWKPVLVGLGMAAVLLTLLAIVQRVTGWWSPTWEWTLPDQRRVTGLYTSPNALGLFVGPVAALYFAWFAWKKKPVLLAPVFAGAFSVVLAVSRGALVAVGAAFVLVLFKAWSKKGAAFLAVLACALAFLSPTVRDLATFNVASGQSRLALYQGTLELLSQHPIKGLGLASFADRYEQVRPQGFTEELIYPHNLLLNFWAETGLLGLVAILWIMIIVVKIARKSRFGWPWLCIAALAVVFIHGLVDVPYFKNDLAMLTWIFLAGLVNRSGHS